MEGRSGSYEQIEKSQPTDDLEPWKEKEMTTG